MCFLVGHINTSKTANQTTVFDLIRLQAQYTLVFYELLTLYLMPFNGFADRADPDQAALVRAA